MPLVVRNGFRTSTRNFSVSGPNINHYHRLRYRSVIVVQTLPVLRSCVEMTCSLSAAGHWRPSILRAYGRQTWHRGQSAVTKLAEYGRVRSGCKRLNSLPKLWNTDQFSSSFSVLYLVIVTVIVTLVRLERWCYNVVITPIITSYVERMLRGMVPIASPRCMEEPPTSSLL